MDSRRRGARPEPFPDPSEEVVRLPVTEDDLAARLDAMPVQKRRPRRQGETQVDLHEERVEAAESVRSEPDATWEADEPPARKETPVGWFALIGVVLLGLGIWALAALREGEELVGERAERVEEGWDAQEQSRREAEALLVQVQRQTRAYLAAETIEEKASYVRHRERVLPLMRSYYARHEFTPVQLESISDLRPFAIEKHPFLYVAATLATGERRALSMEQVSGGGLKFDWESEVAYQPMSLADFVAQKPAEPMTFRVYARLDTFYNFEFSDAQRYQALRLTERDGDGYLFGYIELGSEDSRELRRLLEPSVRVPKPVMLRVRFLPGTRARRSVLVEELVSPRWIYPENPDAAADSESGPEQR